MSDCPRTYVIAEAGINHMGDLALARRMVEIAAAAGADTVKFQTFDPVAIATARAPKAMYQMANGAAGEGQRAMLARIALDESAHRILKEDCERCGIGFLSTPFDLPSLRLLVGKLGLTKIKIGSGDLTNAPLLLEAARAGADLVLSTGMATMDEIAVALGILAFGYLGSDETPSSGAFDRAFDHPRAQAILRQRVCLLQCTTAYPAPVAEANLRAIQTLSEVFHLPVGYSDHTTGIAVAVAAAALGARIIEKHFTLDRSLPGPDQKASLEPDELTQMVAAIREATAALGDGAKRPTDSEALNIAVARKSLVAAKPIRRGERFDTDNLTVKRPGDGIPALRYWDWIGRTAARDYVVDEAIAQ